jgi:hypothetical protein
MRRILKVLVGLVVVAVVLALLVAYVGRGPKSGEVLDEAARAGLTPDNFPPAGRDNDYARKYNVPADYFAAMDNGVELTDDEVKGRDMWLVWTGGDDRFWDALIKNAFGTFDLLKTISSAPGLPFSRDNRWTYLGRQRALLRQADATRPKAFRPVARPAAGRLPARSIRRREEVSRRQDRRARGQWVSRRFLLRRAYGCRRLAAVSQPRFR